MHNTYFNNIVANIKILGIMLICQLIKGSKEKFFIKPNNKNNIIVIYKI